MEHFEEGVHLDESITANSKNTKENTGVLKMFAIILSQFTFILQCLAPSKSLYPYKIQIKQKWRIAAISGLELLSPQFSVMINFKIVYTVLLPIMYRLQAYINSSSNTQ